MIYLDPRITTVDIEGIDVWILESLRDEREIYISRNFLSLAHRPPTELHYSAYSHSSSIFHFFSLVTS
jgi:hypothetical protein